MGVRRDKQAREQPAWTIDYKDENGRRCRTRVHGTKSSAQIQYGLILEAVEKGKMGLLQGERYMYLKDLISMYLKASETDGKSHLTVRRIKNATDALMRIIGGKTPISTVTANRIEIYKQIRLSEHTPRGTKLTPSGLNSELKHNKAMFNWALKKGFLQRTPFLGVSFVQIPDKSIRFLSNEELTSLLRTIKAEKDFEMQDIINFYLQTGARASELLAPKFTWVNVDLNRRIIILIGKRTKRRTQPVNGLLKKILEERVGNKYPFDLTYNQVYRRLKKYYEIAGIKNASVHTLRKTCGAILIQNGVDIYRVSKWLGHSTVSVTEKHYVDLLKSDYEDLSLLLDQSASKYL